MSNWPVGTHLKISGAGNPIPLDFDLTMNYPRRMFSPAAAGSFPLTPGSWVEMAGSFSGWTFQPEGPSGPSIPLLPGACFPVTKDGILTIAVAGSGVPTVIEWPPAIGARIAVGRGYTSGNGASGLPNPKTTPQNSVAGTSNVAAVAGNQVAGGVLAAGGATAPCFVEISADGLNPNGIFVADTQAVAAAFTGMPIYASGIDGWFVPFGGKLWVASSTGAETYYVRIST